MKVRRRDKRDFCIFWGRDGRWKGEICVLSGDKIHGRDEQAEGGREGVNDCCAVLCFVGGRGGNGGGKVGRCRCSFFLCALFLPPSLIVALLPPSLT